MASNDKNNLESEGFSVRKDMYNGYTLDTKYQKCENIKKEFEEKLQGAVTKWKSEGIKAVWVKARKNHSEVVPVCTELGFDFHHAQPGYVMLTKWLPDDIENRIPGFANQYLGVAGFVVNDKGQLLVIQEKYNLIKKHWKLPGGLADLGESVEETARREVLEETGVEAEFISVIAFRHQHQFRYGCSDWYFICLMRPITEEIKHCPHEIGDCKWVDIDEYLSDPDIVDTNRFIVQCYKDGQLKHGGLQIAPSEVLNYSKKSHHKIYCIQQGTSKE
ncbi:nucleoside diphosphate-linked moiety X motif 6-like [Mytilus galloprovincialis]|uniref:nucleoside diphosphate-linked moiety X motif 6-like n=1 Tax=Mytilus galloprovincialis TaxID=29158 RepID=UPI003F7B3AAF